MSNTKNLKAAIERTSEATGLEPTTIGRMVGQGGHFYRRLCDGKRVWPETAESVLQKLIQIETSCSEAAGEGAD
tara:strand:+ start:632 stop:853 length:222 start_codon:yes stop_codon:yes gene_type:complete